MRLKLTAPLSTITDIKLKNKCIYQAVTTNEFVLHGAVYFILAR